MVAERLGHSDPAITLRVYAHVIRQHVEGVAAKFAEAVDRALDLDGEDDEDDVRTRWRRSRVGKSVSKPDPGGRRTQVSGALTWGFGLLPRLVSIQIFEIQSC